MNYLKENPGADTPGYFSLLIPPGFVLQPNKAQGLF